MKKKHLFAISSVAIVMSVSLILTILITYNWRGEYLYNKLNSEIKITSSTLSNFFTYIWRITEDKGRKITEEPSLNKVTINRHLKRQFSQISRSTKMSPSSLWPRFFWLDKNNKISVSSHLGIINDALDISLQPYHFLSSQNPWQLFFSKPHQERGTSKRVINAAIGIDNDQKQHIGSIIIRFEIQKIIERINLALQSNDSYYLMLDRNFNNVLNYDSQIGDIIKKNKELSLAKKLPIPTKKIISLKSPIVIDNISYTKFFKLENYPFMILSGYNKNQYNQETLTIIAKYFFMVLIACLLFSCSIFWIYKIFLRDTSKLKKLLKKIRLVNNNLRSEKKKFINAKKTSDNFFNDIMNAVEEPISLIEENVAKLIKLEVGNVLVTEDARLDTYSDILENLVIVKSFTVNQLSFEEVDVVSLIEESVRHHNHTLIKEKIKIELNYGKNIKYISADRLRFLQIISNLIYTALSDRPRSKISINISNTRKENKKYLKIVILDDGNGLSEDDKENLIDPDNDKTNIYNIKLCDIKKLVKLHFGELLVDSKYSVGTEVTLLLPYDKSVETEKSAPTLSNVVFLYKDK